MRTKDIQQSLAYIGANIDKGAITQAKQAV